MAWASVRCKPQASASQCIAPRCIAAQRSATPRHARHRGAPRGSAPTPPTVLGNHLQLPEIALRARGQDLLR